MSQGFDQARIKKALDDLLYLTPLKEKGSTSDEQTASAPSEDTAGACRPWDRNDLCNRLRSFRASTWFCKPESLSAANCALNGWINTDTDTLMCTCCGERMTLTLPRAQLAAQCKVAEELARKLQAGHGAGCAWRGNACDENLLSHPPTPQPQAVAAFQDRLAGMAQLSQLPGLAPAALKAIAATHRSQLEGLLAGGQGVASAASSPSGEDRFGLTAPEVASKGSPEFEARARLLAMCGWQLHVLPPLRSAQLSPWDGRRAAGVDPLRAVLCCTTCGVRAGVWAFLPQGVTLDSPAGTRVARSESEAATMVVSLLASIAGGAGDAVAQSPSQDGDGKAGRQAPGFGAQEHTPVFRSLSRTLSNTSPPATKRARLSPSKPPAPPQAQILLEAAPSKPAKVDQQPQASQTASPAPGGKGPESPQGSVKEAKPAPRAASSSPTIAGGGPEHTEGAVFGSRPSSGGSPSFGVQRRPTPSKSPSPSPKPAPPSPAAATPPLSIAAPSPTMPAGKDERGAQPQSGPVPGKAEQQEEPPQKRFGSADATPLFGAQRRPPRPAKAPQGSTTAKSPPVLAGGGGGAPGNLAAASKSDPKQSVAASVNAPGPISGNSGGGSALAGPASKEAAVAPQPTSFAQATAPEARGQAATGVNPVRESKVDVADRAAAKGRGGEVAQPNGGASSSSRKRQREEDSETPRERPRAVQGLASASALQDRKHKALKDTAVRSPAVPPAAFDPLKQHRPFCSWALQKAGRDWRCGWAWTLDSLTPKDLHQEPQELRKSSRAHYNPAARLQQVLQGVKIAQTPGKK